MSRLHPRGAKRRHSLLRGGVFGAGATAALLLAAGPAAADTASVDVVWLKPITITVASNGDRYTTVEPSAGNIEGQIKVVLDAGILGRVASFDAWPLLHLGFKPGESETLGEGFKGTGMSKAKTYSSPRPKKVNETFFFSIPRARYQYLFVKACNQHADELRGAGQSDSEIFAQDRTIKMIASSSMSYKLTGPDRVLFSDPPLQITDSDEIDVICKAVPPAPEVEQATLSVRGDGSLRGACSLKLSGMIRTNLPNTTVKFRYHSDDGRKSDLKSVVTEHHAAAPFSDEYPLPEGGTRSGKVRIVGENLEFTSDWADYEVDCSAPARDVATVLPPKAAAMVFGVREEVAHRGLLCPSVISVEGLIEGRGTASGAVAVFADGELKKLQQYTIEDKQSVLVAGEHALTWGPTQAQQTVKLAMNVTNAKAALVDQLEKTVNVTCRQVQTSGVGQGAAGGISAGKPKHSQQAAVGQLVQPQGFAIQAPKGLVRKGEVRLTSGAANGKYTLAFLRKSGGGYVKVQSAQLPRQMTGLVAGFPLKALSGGRDWRIEVCPDGGSPAACKTADFRLSRIGAAGAAATAPAPDQPQGTPVFLVPGAMQ